MTERDISYPNIDPQPGTSSSPSQQTSQASFQLLENANQVDHVYQEAAPEGNISDLDVNVCLNLTYNDDHRFEGDDEEGFDGVDMDIDSDGNIINENPPPEVPNYSYRSRNAKRTTKSGQRKVHAENPSRQPKFKTCPDLALYFKKVFNAETGRYMNSCKLCSQDIKAHMLESLFKHLISICPNTNEEIKSKFSVHASKSIRVNQNHIANYDWARIIVKNNLPLRLQSDNHFRLFFRTHAPQIKIADRETMSSFYIEKLARRTDGEFLTKISSDQHDYSVQIEFDHWLDANHRSILGISATFADGTKHIISIEDVSVEGHGSDAIVSSLMKALAFIPDQKINSFVSDNASTCVAARRKIADEARYKHVMQHRCCAHWIDLVGKKICSSDPATSIIEAANHLTNTINSDMNLSGQFRQANMRRLRRATASRWFSTVPLLESLVDVKNEAILILQRPANLETRRNSRPELLQQLLSAELWHQIDKLLEVTRPLADSIAAAEESDGNLSTTTRNMLNYAREVMSGDWEDSLNLLAIKSFLLYFSEAKLGDELALFLTAYALDHNNSMNFISESGEELVAKFIYRIATRIGMGGYANSQALGLEVAAYFRRDGVFATPPVEGAPEKWWATVRGAGILKRVAQRVCNLRSSSANIERIWSTLKNIQSPNRQQLSLHSIENMGKIRVAMEPGHSEDIVTAMEDINIDVIDDDLVSSQGSIASVSGLIANLFSMPSCRRAQRRIIYGHKPEKLVDPKITASYDTFIALIDFDIMNDHSERFNEVPVVEENNEEDYMASFRSSRSQNN